MEGPVWGKGCREDSFQSSLGDVEKRVYQGHWKPRSPETVESVGEVTGLWEEGVESLGSELEPED